MYKKLFIYIFILTLSISVVFGNSIEPLKPELAVKTAFDVSKAKLDHININSYVRIDNNFIAIDNGSKICNDISEKLGMKEISIKKKIEENSYGISVKGILCGGVYATIILRSSKLENPNESTIVIDIIETKGQYALEKLCDKIRDVLLSYGKVNLNVNIVGYYNGFVDNKELKIIIDRLFEAVGAEGVEGIDEDNLISITGYTPNIKEHISYCGKKANINIATRLNSYENKTYIWIGTPLIVEEY
ncbi:MAG: YwmB family TATA-box binding protein [Maledivibacter sp.]|jgi:hypothetical protein|nr:YwmB family TATA-box binding protein [Maledivibacter sp.]